MEGRLFEDLVVSRARGHGARAGGMPFSLVAHAAAMAGLPLVVAATESCRRRCMAAFPIPASSWSMRRPVRRTGAAPGTVRAAPRRRLGMARPRACGGETPPRTYPGRG